jgi:hypothetical protein
VILKKTQAGYYERLPDRHTVRNGSLKNVTENKEWSNGKKNKANYQRKRNSRSGKKKTRKK